MYNMLSDKEEKEVIDHRKKWYRFHHFKRWEFSPTVDWIKPIINDLKTDKYGLSSSSSFARTIPIEFAKLYIMLDRVDLICTVFRLKLNDVHINYSYLYSSPYNYFPHKLNSKTNKKLYHRYACFGPSLESHDGEYRYRFNEPDRILDYVSDDADLMGLWKDLCKFIKIKMKNEELAIFVDYFYPTIDIENDYNYILETDVENNDYKINFLVISWFSELVNINAKSQQNHINEKFNDVLFSQSNIDTKFIKQMIVKHGKSIIDKFYYVVIHMTTTRVTQTPIFGQKIVPLNLSEVENPLNIQGKPWNEIYINNVINSLVVNVISPSFPILSDWFYIKNTNKSLFDNKKIYEKMENSENAKLISKKLAEAQRQIYHTGMYHKEEKILPIYKELYHNVEENIDLSKALSMSNVALCIISEYIGRTIADIPHLISQSFRSNIFSNTFSSISYFRKYMFDIIYSLFCMNSKCGIIHGDLHLNNAVVQIRLPENESISSDNVHVVYIMDSKSIDITTQAKVYNGITSSQSVYETISTHKNKFQFILPHEFMYWSIIDFSRSTVHPDFINLDAFPNEMGNITISKDMKEKYINKQRRQIEKGYISIIESFDENIHNKLKIGLIDNFDSIWKLYTAVDIYKFSKFLMAKLASTTNIKIDPQCIKLLKKINDIAYQHLNIKLEITLNEKTPSSELEYPNFDIIKECFHDCMVENTTDPKNIKLSDMYIYSNELKYSLGAYNHFPPYMQDWYGIKDLKHPSKKYKLNDTNHQQFIKARVNLEDRQKKDMETIWLISRRQREKNL